MYLHLGSQPARSWQAGERRRPLHSVDVRPRNPGEQAIERLWHVRGGDPFSPRYNVAPTTQVPMVYVDRHEGGRRLALARWGLIPFWAKGPKPPSHTFNARPEEAPGKAMWRQPLRNARCIIPALGWYEWKEREAVDQATDEVRKYKQSYFMHLPDNQPIGFAGLMAWAKPDGSDESTNSCSILTTAASGTAADVHDRMPVALAESVHDAWLGPTLVDPGQGNALVAENQLASTIEKHAVST
jgi:putative SOS response-associated peptidase YedK